MLYYVLCSGHQDSVVKTIKLHTIISVGKNNVIFFQSPIHFGVSGFF